MSKALRRIGIALGSLAGLLLVAALVLFVISEIALRQRHSADAERLAPPSPALAADAGRQARVLGCINCHGEGLRGELMADIPGVLRMIAPNIPKIAAKASDQQLAAAIRQGIGHDGRGLFVMPSPQLSRLTDAEVSAMIAWIRSLPPVDGLSGKVTLGPLGRASMVFGKLKPAPGLLPEYRQQMPIALGRELERGRHLASVACAECHGPALFGQGMPFGEAPDLRIAGGYDLAQFDALLRTGRAASGKPLDMMKDVAVKSFVNMTDAEIAALHAYLDARAKKLGS